MKRSERELPDELIQKALKHWIIYYLFNGLHFSSTERFSTSEEAEKYIKEHDNSDIHYTYIVKNVSTGHKLVYDSEEGYVDFE